MKKIILLLFLLLNIFPYIENGSVKIDSVGKVFAQSFGEEIEVCAGLTTTEFSGDGCYKNYLVCAIEKDCQSGYEIPGTEYDCDIELRGDPNCDTGGGDGQPCYDCSCDPSFCGSGGGSGPPPGGTTTDCAGVSGGSAVMDLCGTCVGGTTGKTVKYHFRDADGDGWGNSANYKICYDAGSGWVTKGGDYNDNCHNTANDPNQCSSTPDCNSFSNRVSSVLNHEGGFVNNPNDPGGATNRGIAWNTWEAVAYSVLGKAPTLANLQALTENEAKIIYKSLYWDKISADAINDGDIRYMLFDFYVNAGGNGVKVLQKTLNQNGANVTVDGVMGAQTIAAINNSNPIIIYNSYKSNRQTYYNNLAAKSAKLATFLNGWTNRVNSFANKTTSNSSNVNCP